jgi:predicted pyridoxine 5'-phosphate oxidase superfamily flavin-nucleotide-binding protein
MRHPVSSRYLEIATTPSVSAAQTRYNGRAHAVAEAGRNDPLGPREAAFIQSMEGFYLGTVSETGWPYIQYRGGPPGFLRVLDAERIGFADFAGNRQYLTAGNLAANAKVALFLMDYAHRRRLKLLGRATIVDPGDDAQLAQTLAVGDYRARVERLIVIRVEGFNWNCSQHITQRFPAADVAAALAMRDARIAELAAELERLRGRHAP